MGTGQTNVKNYNRHLCRLIELGKATPSFIVSHELTLDEAPDAYAHFDAREKGWTKDVLRPHASKTTARAPGVRSRSNADRDRQGKRAGHSHH